MCRNGWKFFCHYFCFYDFAISNFQDPNKGPGRGNLETENNFIEIPNLHPYSFYDLEVKANVRPRIPRPESKKIVGETLQGVPDVKPNDGPINTKLRDTELTFYWRPPNNSSCENFNGKLDGYRVILKGIDTWNIGRFVKLKISKGFDLF